MIPPAIPRLVLAFGLLGLGLLVGPVLAANPADPVGALITQAREAQGQGNTELALRLAQSAIVADPARPTSYVALGDIYAAAGQQDFARTYYNEALAIDPADPSALKAVTDLDHNTPRVLAAP